MKRTTSTGQRRARARSAARKGFASAAIAAMILVGAAGTAAAAGSPYSGPPVLPTGGVPGGYRSVLTAITVGKSGKIIILRTDGILGRLLVPAGAAPFGEQVILTKAILSGISLKDLKKLPSFLAHPKVVFGLGVLFQRDQHAITGKKFVTFDLSGKQLNRHEFIVVYSPAAHGFVPAPKGHARVVDGHMVIRLLAGTEFLVLGP